jgi:hypothetical protein
MKKNGERNRQLSSDVLFTGALLHQNLLTLAL